MNILSKIESIVAALKAGQTMLYETDTVWGIGCDATNMAAVQKVYNIKQRIDSKALIVLVSDSEQLKVYVEKLPKTAIELLVQNKERPTTIIYPKARNLAKNLLASDGSIAIRIPRSNVFLKDFLLKFGKPIVSTSANISGQPTPLSFENISDLIKNEVDFVVQEMDFVAQKKGTAPKPSRIIKLEMDGRVRVIRE